MKPIANTLHICITGSLDFVRRMSNALRQAKLPFPIALSTGNFTEARALVLAERPDVFLFDVSHKTSRSELPWIRVLLSQFRERYQKEIQIILAVTSCEKFAFAGSLLFEDDISLGASGLIDSFLITPPTGVPQAPSLEQQFLDCLHHMYELTSSGDKRILLPSLWEDNWTPSMSDPESRNIWMRWLPRYARYVNENPLIVGPTGSGKTRLAAAIHYLSERKGPFISITPRDFSSMELVQAELFGAVPGAYTGAVEKWGLVAKAEKGTLFIDELQSIDRDLQGKLITFIENKTYRRVGEAESHQADVRFVFATNRSLQELVDEGALRDDFAYRLERLQLTLRPLSERRLDIAAGICFALAKILRERAQSRSAHSTSSESMSHLEGISHEAYRKLYSASWPGNLRQLENTIAKLIELADIDHTHLIEDTKVEEAIAGTLGFREANASDIFQRAAKKVITSSENTKLSSLVDYVTAITEEMRFLALDLSGGDVEKAATLIQDSKIAMNLFASTHGPAENS